MATEVDRDGQTILGIGKVHTTHTFSHIYDTDPRYVDWVLSEPRNGTLGNFAAWCQRKKQCAAPSSPSRPAPPATAAVTPTTATTPSPFTCRVHSCPMRGPFTSRNGETHNIGRQFYTCQYNGRMGKSSREADGQTDCGVDGFKWADGTDAFSATSCRRAEAFHGAPHDSIGVGVGGLFGTAVVGDELRRGESGFQELSRGGVLVNPQPAKRRREDDGSDSG